MKALYTLYALYARYANVLNLKPNCTHSTQSIEQHYYRETEEQNSNDANCL